MEALYPELVALAQVTIIDVVLAGDNAIVVGIAASRVAPEFRGRVIIWGVAGAVVLRIAFAAVTLQLLAIIGLTLAGGILLKCTVSSDAQTAAEAGPAAVSTDGPAKGALGFWSALINVLAVAGAAKGHTWVLVTGLSVSVV